MRPERRYCALMRGESVNVQLEAARWEINFADPTQALCARHDGGWVLGPPWRVRDTSRINSAAAFVAAKVLHTYNRDACSDWSKHAATSALTSSPWRIPTSRCARSATAEPVYPRRSPPTLDVRRNVTAIVYGTAGMLAQSAR